MQKIHRIGAIVLALGMVAASAQAHVLDKKADSKAFKLRGAVAKQIATYRACVLAATNKCEKYGVASGPECDPNTGAVAYELTPGKKTAAFQGTLAKCDANLALSSKGTDYTGIGCPGDCDTDAGTQECVSLDAYESTIEGVGGRAKLQASALHFEANAACAGAGAGAPDSEERIDCVLDATSDLAVYSKKLFACQLACEGDTRGKKGGGALTNSPVCQVGAEAHASLTECEQKAASKLSAEAASLAASFTSEINDSTNDLFNREQAGDPASPAGALSPCGTCGDGAQEGVEECDGSDLGTCEACASDCTCTPAVCGNGVIEGSEVCDGDELGTCTTSCAGDCTCAPELDDPILDGPAGTFCSTAFNSATTDYQPVCVPTEGSGRHFRIEGAQVFAQNSFFYLALGFPEAPTGNPATTLGDGRFIFTGGKSQSCSFGWSYFRYSGITDPAAASLCNQEIFGDYTAGPQEICLDVSDHTTPNVTFWATGKNGANCKDRSTLTAETALYGKDDWASADNQPINDVIHYVKVNNAAGATLQTVLVSSNTVLDYGPQDPILDGPAGTFCETAFNPASSDYQPLCVPTEGSGRHFRIEDAQTLGNNGFFYLAMGFPAAPTGNPATAVGDGRFIFTGGKSQSCSFGWSYFRYSGITDPAAASLCTAELFGDYTVGPQEVCLDVSGDTPPRVTFWATGEEGADCQNRYTLTEASALYSKDDWASADNQPVAEITHYIKVSNTSLATLGNVAVSSNMVLD